MIVSIKGGSPRQIWVHWRGRPPPVRFAKVISILLASVYAVVFVFASAFVFAFVFAFVLGEHYNK